MFGLWVDGDDLTDDELAAANGWILADLDSDGEELVMANAETTALSKQRQD